jgi:NAD(P)-dependent dehydrogenase (short-subunit alcohol dehydrogenase family)
MHRYLAKEALGEEGLKAHGSMTALQRMGDPAEAGAAAAFLASSDSRNWFELPRATSFGPPAAAIERINLTATRGE